MSISYLEVKNYLKKYGGDFEGIVRGLENLLILGRNEKNIPIYSTKERIKTQKSTYLKTKRFDNIKTLDDITDYAGLRVLCLFEQDILKVHDFLVETFCEYGYELINFKIYGWTNDAYVNRLRNTVKNKFPLDITPNEKKSGYKALHYIVTIQYRKRSYPIEIQLKTLLQDVWGELEHTISYKKGSIHPHIRKSFQLLARDIETNDTLLTHLREVGEKQICAERFFATKAGPRNYFDYEEDYIPPSFENAKIQSLWIRYADFVKNSKLKNNNIDWVDEAKNHYDVFRKETIALAEQDEKLNYILEVESAFLLFAGRKHDEALNKYNELLDNYTDHYVVHFRKGEILFIKGEIEEALAYFDDAEQLLSKRKADYSNKYIVKMRLAYTYWLLGQEYIKIASDKIDEAETIYNAHLTKDASIDYAHLLNNIAWYKLEKYVLSKEKMDREPNKEDREKMASEVEEYYMAAKEKCLEVEADLKNNPTSHMYDTVAYFYCQKYLKDKDKSPLDLEKAKKYCSEMHEIADYTSFTHRSWDLRMNHIQEIESLTRDNG